MNQELEEVYAIWPELSKECNVGLGSTTIGMSMKGLEIVMANPLLKDHAVWGNEGVVIHGTIRIPYDK